MKNSIIKGDVLSVLKDITNNEFIDCGVTSPPYNNKKIGGGIFRKIEYDNFDDNMNEEDYQLKQIDILNELYRLIKPGGSFFYNHKLRYVKGDIIHPWVWLNKTDWHIRQEIIWNKKTAVEVGGYRFYQKEERIYWLYKPVNDNIIGKRLEGKDARLGSIWEVLPDRKNSHPAPFPLEIPLRCIMSVMRNVSNGIVINPYMGSGTTAVAARLLKHNYIGIDNSQTYIDKANERIYNYKQYSDILDKENKLHYVKKSYKQRKQEMGLF